MGGLGEEVMAGFPALQGLHALLLTAAGALVSSVALRWLVRKVCTAASRDLGVAYAGTCLARSVEPSI